MNTPTTPTAPSPGLCACSCGKPVKPGRKFLRGHGNRPGFRFSPAESFLEACARQRAPADLIEQFWSLVQILGPGSAPGSCWIWNGPVSKDGYGRFKGFLAHRVAWELTVGPIPFGFQINHGPCDLPRCVSPDHLFLGFQEVNVRDCASKGRIARKLLPVQVVEARELYRQGWSIPAIAERFSCNPVTMKDVIAEESWVHLTPAMVSIPIQAATKVKPWVTTPDLVEAIGADYVTGATQRTIARQYGTSKTTVARILSAAVPAQDRRARVLTRAQAQQILDLHRDGATLRSIAPRFGVSDVTIGDIVRGKTFKALKGPRTPSQRLKPADVQAIRRLHRNGVSSQAIATQFEVSWLTIRRIVTGRTWQSLAEAA